jgi:alpha/beta superfamily hydrolase
MRRLPRRKEARIPGPTGEIEALVELPGEADANGFGVACHPHPLHGGTMDNKVVHTLCRTFNELGRAAVRFNFRGAGASEGTYGEGVGEIDDALAVVAWARDQFGGDAWLAGFSFGAAVALHAAAREAPARLITVAPPVGRLPVATETQPDCPWLVVQGGDDELVEADAVVAWVNELAPGPELLLLPGVDHFFHGKLTVLREQLLDWLRSGSADQD